MKVRWSEGENSIEWNNRRVSIHFPAPVQQVVYRKSEPKVLVIYGDSLPENRLRALNSSGESMFDAAPPTNRNFFCFVDHLDIEHAVVCNSTNDSMDWIYAIDVERQELVSLNRAY